MSAERSAEMRGATAGARARGIEQVVSRTRSPAGRAVDCVCERCETPRGKP